MLADTAALVRELQAGRLTATIDVVDPEPLPEHPLWRAPGVIITPQAAGITTAHLPKLHELVQDQLDRYAEGRPLLNVV